jgi:hypothetical protein
VAVVAGAFLGRRRRDGWLCFNLASMILGYWIRTRVLTWDEPLYLYWGLADWVAQVLLVAALSPWLFERAAAWRRGGAPVALVRDARVS